MATDIHTRSVADALASLQSAAGGLSSAEAARRLREHGPNRVEPAARAPWPRRLAREYVSFFSLILWAAAALAFLAAAWDPGQDTLRVGLAIVAVILISGSFSFWQENRIERALAALRALLPPQATVLRDGAPQRLPAEQLVPGDLLLIEAGQRVP
ncbi:MAG TPA: cation-transporting P-type ATPase, partial [Burkholderiaceae bacterium]|nr:cation-transporting P-type ATPase [Burkholderiaceae bacterium]